MAVSVITCPTFNWPSTVTRPSRTVAIGHEPERFPAHDDAGGLLQGYACYRSGGTQYNDMTVAADEHGITAALGAIYLVELDEWGVHQAYNHADAAYSADDPITVVRCQIGKKYWLKCVSLTIVEDTIYNITDGFITAIDDPTPDAVVYNVHGFRSLAYATTLTGWAPYEYVGLVAIDSTG